jgi:hypothetical protein
VIAAGDTRLRPPGRRRAIAGNWCAAALDDDQLDTPATAPEAAGGPPPAPASPPTSARRPDTTTEGKAHEGSPDRPRPVQPRYGRIGPARVRCGDDEYAGRAIFLIRDLARIYEGTQDHPVGPSIDPAPFPQKAPLPPGPGRRDAVIVPAAT